MRGTISNLSRLAGCLIVGALGFGLNATPTVYVVNGNQNTNSTIDAFKILTDGSLTVYPNLNVQDFRISGLGLTPGVLHGAILPISRY